MRHLVGSTVAVLVTYLSVISSATACIVQKPIDYNVFSKAEIVMRAQIVEYRKVGVGVDARLELRPIEYLSARKLGTEILSARWSRPDARAPEEWKWSTDVIIGLRKVIDRDGKTVLAVVQQVCGPRTILDDNPANVSQVKAGMEARAD